MKRTMGNRACAVLLSALLGTAALTGCGKQESTDSQSMGSRS